MNVSISEPARGAESAWSPSCGWPVWLDRLVEQPPVKTPVDPEIVHEGQNHA